MAMVFAREVTAPLTGLVKKIDAATAKNSKCRMGSFVVLMTDDEDVEKKLKDLAKKEEIKKTVLTIDNPAGPKSLKIAKDAAVTVVLYKNKKVTATYPFKKGELKAKDVDKILSEVQTLCSEEDK